MVGRGSRQQVDGLSCSTIPSFVRLSKSKWDMVPVLIFLEYWRVGLLFILETLMFCLTVAILLLKNATNCHKCQWKHFHRDLRCWINQSVNSGEEHFSVIDIFANDFGEKGLSILFNFFLINIYLNLTDFMVYMKLCFFPLSFSLATFTLKQPNNLTISLGGFLFFHVFSFNRSNIVNDFP